MMDGDISARYYNVENEIKKISEESTKETERKEILRVL